MDMMGFGNLHPSYGYDGFNTLMKKVSTK